MRLLGFGVCLVGSTGFCALSCSDPVAPPAQGAMEIRIYPPSNAGANKCSLPAHVKILSGNPTDTAKPSKTEPGERLIDGQDGASVKCTVSGGGSFSVSASVLKDPVSFGMSASINGTTGTGSVSEYDPDDTVTLISDPAGCTFTVTPPQEIASGRVWGSFSCPTNFRDPNQPGGTSCASEGNFVFENCQE